MQAAILDRSVKANNISLGGWGLEWDNPFDVVEKAQRNLPQSQNGEKPTI